MFILSIFLFISSISSVVRRDFSIQVSRVSVIVLTGCLFLAYFTTDYLVVNKGVGLFGNLFYISSTTQTFKTFIFLICIIILSITSFYPRKYIRSNIMSNKISINSYINNGTLKNGNLQLMGEEIDVVNIEGNQEVESQLKKDKILRNKLNTSLSYVLNIMNEQFRIIEYSLLILLILTGSIFLLSTSDFVSVFLSIELQSYGLYLICSIYKNSELATSAGLTYFLLGGLASCFILLGTALLYSNSANMNLDGLYIINNLSNAIIENISRVNWYLPDYIYYSLLILAIGLLFKISAAPFHFWSPDVYDNIPTIVTTFVALIPKLSILILMLELVHYTGNVLINSDLSWTSGLLLSSFLSLIIGTILGLTQSRIKRLFAYSTISHLGFILLALSVNSVESNQSFIFYLIQYTVSNLNAFILLLTMGYGLFFYVSDNVEYNKLQDKNNSPIQLTNQIKGYHFLNPILTLSFTITLFSFVGIPPLIGFFAKQMVLSSALDKGYVFIVLTGILTSVIAAVYYLTIIKKMYFDKHEYTLIELGKYNIYNIFLSSHLTISISLISLIIIGFIFVPLEFLNMSNILISIMYMSTQILCDSSDSTEFNEFILTNVPWVFVMVFILATVWLLAKKRFFFNNVLKKGLVKIKEITVVRVLVSLFCILLSFCVKKIITGEWSLDPSNLKDYYLLFSVGIVSKFISTLILEEYLTNYMMPFGGGQGDRYKPLEPSYKPKGPPERLSDYVKGPKDDIILGGRPYHWYESWKKDIVEEGKNPKHVIEELQWPGYDPNGDNPALTQLADVFHFQEYSLRGKYVTKYMLSSSGYHLLKDYLRDKHPETYNYAYSSNELQPRLRSLRLNHSAFSTLIENNE